MSDFERIEKVIRFLEQYRSQQPDLDRLAEHVGLSRFHLQRLFSRWAGVSPKSFLKVLNLVIAKRLLKNGESVLSTALETGLSGPGRLHDLCVGLESATPGEIKSGGRGWTVFCGIAESPFGPCVVGENRRGICHLSFAQNRSKAHARLAIQADWPNATIEWNDERAAAVASTVFARPEEATSHSLRAYVGGTQFQVKVWRALLGIPHGELTSYSRLANAIGRPTATRAVASAVAKNNIAYLIPCHRVIRETGAISDYRWCRDRKIAMVAWEHAVNLQQRNRTRESINGVAGK